MATFFFAFVLLGLVVTGMSLGVIFMDKRIKGSCGGLNAVAGADKCLVCKREVDPDSPLHERFQCPRRQSASS